jgi:hypothetical protein
MCKTWEHCRYMFLWNVFNKQIAILQLSVLRTSLYRDTKACVRAEGTTNVLDNCNRKVGMCLKYCCYLFAGAECMCQHSCPWRGHILGEQIIQSRWDSDGWAAWLACMQNVGARRILLVVSVRQDVISKCCPLGMPYYQEVCAWAW